MEASVESYAARAAEKDIELSVFVDPELPTAVIGDPTKISQVLLNLVSNAVKFTPENGMVDVFIEHTAESDSDVTIKFSVKDTGIGISKEQKKKIFDAFSQADVSTSRKFGGTGLGLAISSKLVEMMGGRLDIKSVEGEGSTFFFSLTLPKAPDAKRRETVDLHDTVVGLLANEGRYTPSTKYNLKRYVEYAGGTFATYTDAMLFGDAVPLPDILFINHRYYRHTKTLRRYFELGTKTVLMTTAKKKEKLGNLIDSADYLLFKPLNQTKSYKALETLKEEESDLSHTFETSIAPEERRFDGLRVLVAEDNRINQKLITNILERLGIDVTLANNGEEALKRRMYNDYDLIFMDIQMPVMSGIEATEKILRFEKENQRRHIPIVALTANALKGDREKYLDAGMDDYLSKPIELDRLTELLHTYFPEKEKEVARKEASVVDVSEKEEEEELQDACESDIILFHSERLIAKVYEGALRKLGFDPIVFTDPDKLLECLERTNARFVLFEGRPFTTTKCLIGEFIRDAGAKAIAIVPKGENGNRFCSDYVEEGDDVEVLKSKLL
jgi:CheY-like chemotaxis protein